MSGDPELIDIWLTGILNPESLTEQEFLRFSFLLHINLLQFQNNYYLVQKGTLEKKVLNSITINMTLVKGTPGFEKYWKLRSKLFYPEFKLYIQKLMFSSQIEENQIYKVRKQK